jgi:hypothetical protein
LFNCLSGKPRKRLVVPNRRKILKCVPEKPNPPLQFRKYQKDALEIHPCVTSTPNGISCRENSGASPLLSPIINSVQKGQRSEVINDITEGKRNSVCGSTSLSKSVGVFDARQNILPEVHQFDSSFKGSNMSNKLLSLSVVEESVSKNICKFAINKEKSSHVSANTMLHDSVILIDCVSSQLQSCKLDEKIVSAIGSSNELCDPECELRKAKESFTCTDQKFDMNDSIRTISVSGSNQNSPVHYCADMNVRRQKNMNIKCVGRSLCRSNGSWAEELLGFSDIPLEQHLSVGPIKGSFLGLSDVSVEQHSCDKPRTGGFMGFADVSVKQDICEDPITGGSLDLSDAPKEQSLNKDPITDVVRPDLHILSDGSNKCAESNGVTEGFNSAANLPSSESRNVSIVLFDSWDSGNGTKLQTTLERPYENKEAVVFDESQVSTSRLGNNNSENSRTDVSKLHHLHESLLDVDESYCKSPGDKSELLRSSISKEHLFQEPSDTITDTGEPHTDDVTSLLSQPYFTVDGNPSRFKMRGTQVPHD